MPIGTGDSSSSARSIRSIQSNTTVKAISPPPTSSSTAFPYTVGRLSTFHDTDTDMDDPFSMPTHVGHHRHRIDSQGVPIPPARTTSLGQHGHSNSVSSSDNSLPSVQVTTATPTKRSSKYTHNQHPYQGHGHGYDQHQYSNTFGHGSLDVTEDRGYSFPHYSSSTDQFTSTSVEDDSDAEPELREMKVPEKEEDKLERQRRQGRERQRRKRARDKQDKQNSQVQVQPAGFVGSTPTPTSTNANSRNPSTTSLAPIIVPNLHLNMNMNMNMSMTTMRSSASSSSVYSSLPTSASFPSTSPNTQTHQSISTSGTSSPTTFFSPMTPATNSGQDGYPWTTTPNRASKSAVDVRTTQLSRSNTGKNHRPRIVAPPPHRVPLASSSTSSHSAKRRRSEPEPEHFKTKQVGLGMNMPPQDQSQGQGPIEFLSTPTDENGSIKKERPGMRRTASDSAATALEFSHTHQSRSPTPPLLESLKSGYIPLDPLPHSQSQAGLLASVALAALVDNPSENVKRALSELKFTREGLLGLQPELSSFFGRFCLEKEMGAVTLEDRTSTSYPTIPGFTSNATTPYHEDISLSTTSTRPPSPMRMEIIPTTSTSRPTTSKATPKTSRARSLSSASMRARGLKMSSANTTTNAHKSPALSLYQETMISPMSTTPYQFPNTPVTAMPDSDEASASPMMSAVQTPTTGQSQAFPHHEILAIGQGTMRVDQGRPRHAEGEGGGGGYQHQRSATEGGGGGGKGWNQPHSHTHGHGHAHARTGSNWELQQTNQRPNSSYPQNIPQSHSMPGLSSPLDMPYRQAPIAPPPHLPPPAFEFTYPQHQNHASTVHQNQQPTSFQTPSHRHHNSSSGLSTPFTPSPAQHHSHNHTGGGGVYQPTFTPIAEMGTPTRPSPREPRMLAYDPFSMGRMGEMDQMVLSPPPQVQPGMMEGNWMAFGQVMPHTAPGTDGGGFGADPFGGNPQQQR